VKFVGFYQYRVEFISVALKDSRTFFVCHSCVLAPLFTWIFVQRVGTVQEHNSSVLSILTIGGGCCACIVRV